MKIIRPLSFFGSTLTTPTITSTSVTTPESGTTDWLVGTTYALGDRVTSESSALNFTVTIATPAVFTIAAHEFLQGDAVSFTTTGALPTGLTVSRTYYVKDITTSTFKISATIGGASLNTSGSQSGTHTLTLYTYKTYISLQAANLGKPPRKASNSAWWTADGYTNRYKMFDGSVTSQSKASVISVDLTVNSPVDTVALLNISGVSVNIICTDTALGLVWSSTHSLALSGVTPAEYATDFLLTSIPNFSSGVLTIGVSQSASLPELCALGACLVGKAFDIGTTEEGLSVGIQDYSIVEANAFGDYDITERAFAKRGSFTAKVLTADIPRVYRILSEQRAKKCLYIGSDSHTSTAIYGFPADWSIVIQYETYAILNIELKGLT